MAEPAAYLSRIFKHHGSILLQPRGKRRPRAGWQQERLQKNLSFSDGSHSVPGHGGLLELQLKTPVTFTS